MTTVATTRPIPRARRGSLAPRVAVAGLLAALILTAGYLGVSYKVVEEITHIRRSPVDHVPAIASPIREDVTFRTQDGLTLRGWFYRVPGDRAVVLVHGREGNRLIGDHFERLAEVLLPAGYSLLTFDMRGSGESDGDRYSLGEYERYDVAAAVDLVRARGFTPRHVALWGESMGAATVLQAIELRADIGPVVADSSFTDLRSVAEEVAPASTGLPSEFTPGILLMARLLGMNADDISPIRVVRSQPDRAFFFIHCDKDEIVPPHGSPDLAAASASRASELWIAPGCGHVKAMEAYPAYYAQRLLAFLAANMP